MPGSPAFWHFTNSSNAKEAFLLVLLLLAGRVSNVRVVPSTRDYVTVTMSVFVSVSVPVSIFSLHMDV